MLLFNQDRKATDSKVDCLLSFLPKTPSTLTASFGGKTTTLRQGTKNTVPTSKTSSVEVFVSDGRRVVRGPLSYRPLSIHISSKGGGTIPAGFTVKIKSSFTITLTPRPRGTVFPEVRGDDIALAVDQTYVLRDPRLFGKRAGGLGARAPGGKVDAKAEFGLILVGDEDKDTSRDAGRGTISGGGGQWMFAKLNKESLFVTICVPKIFCRAKKTATLTFEQKLVVTSDTAAGTEVELASPTFFPDDKPAVEPLTIRCSYTCT